MAEAVTALEGEDWITREQALIWIGEALGMNAPISALYFSALRKAGLPVVVIARRVVLRKSTFWAWLPTREGKPALHPQEKYRDRSQPGKPGRPRKNPGNLQRVR